MLRVSHPRFLSLGFGWLLFYRQSTQQASRQRLPAHLPCGVFAAGQVAIFSDELPRTPSRRSSQNTPQTNFRLCEVALLGHHPRSARHGSTEREFFHLGVHVSIKLLHLVSGEDLPRLASRTDARYPAPGASLAPTATRYRGPPAEPSRPARPHEFPVERRFASVQ
jgi:hypothetical protein